MRFQTLQRMFPPRQTALPSRIQVNAGRSISFGFAVSDSIADADLIRASCISLNERVIPTSDVFVYSNGRRAITTTGTVSSGVTLPLTAGGGATFSEGDRIGLILHRTGVSGEVPMVMRVSNGVLTSIQRFTVVVPTTITVSVTPNGTTSLPITQGLVVYPNPLQDEESVTVEWLGSSIGRNALGRTELGELSVVDMMGRVVQRVLNVRSMSGENRFVLPIGKGMSSGMYRMVLSTPSGRISAPLKVVR
jgi:hypothetical protein